MEMSSRNRRLEHWAAWVVALLGPALITAVLERLSGSIQRDYVFIYLGLVAGVAVVSGLWPALVCAGMSFLLVDYFFVPPFGTLTIADEQDIVNLAAFLVTAVVVGLLASRRRRNLMAAEALGRRALRSVPGSKVFRRSSSGSERSRTLRKAGWEDTLPSRIS
jgi:two-component system sensor histidine kinase KdpD